MEGVNVMGTGKWISGLRINHGEIPARFTARLGNVSAALGMHIQTLEAMIRDRGWDQGGLTSKQLCKLGAAVKNFLTNE